MAVKIRLNRMGAKKKPFYRVIVADARAPRDGRFIANLGYYDATKQPAVVKINEEIINTKVEKFGALVGDFSKIGANAVLTPGTILMKNTVVKRLELIEQIK